MVIWQGSNDDDIVPAIDSIDICSRETLSVAHLFCAIPASRHLGLENGQKKRDGPETTTSLSSLHNRVHVSTTPECLPSCRLLPICRRYCGGGIFQFTTLSHRSRIVFQQSGPYGPLLLRSLQAVNIMAGLVADRVLLQSTPLSRDCFQVRHATKPPRILLPQIRSSLPDGNVPSKTLACTSHFLHCHDATSRTQYNR